MKKLTLSLFIISLTACILSCNTGENKQINQSEGTPNIEQEILAHKGLFGALGAVAENPDNPSTPEKITLGHKLYFEKNLSKDGNISCNSCHNLESWGVDNLPTSPGDAGKNGDRNSPTVLNAAFHSSQFWDGRAKDVEEQAGMPILNPVEMAIPDKDFLMKRLAKMPEYQKMFKAAFPKDKNPLSYDNLQRAIGVFERQLITPSRFDKWLSGDSSALSIQEKKGLAAFVKVGCTTCHNGSTIGGNIFQKFGVYHNYQELTKSQKVDDGLYAITKKESDKFLFKVPSLRNIGKTGPYFHDGSVSDLGDAVKIMAKAQLNVDITPEEQADIVAFLNSLTGEVPEQFKQAPSK